MCIGGNDKATKKAARAERERQAQIREGREAVDEAFLGRDDDIGQFADSLRAHFSNLLEREQQRNARQLRFGLARGGLTSGSFAKDAGFNLSREFQEGTLQNDRRVQGAVSELEQADEAARMNLYNLVQAGGDAGTAAARAGAALQSNIGGAQAAGLAQGVGDVFGGTADLYKRQQEAAERRRGLRESQLYTNPFSRGDA